MKRPTGHKKIWTGTPPKKPKEIIRLCIGCRKPMWLSEEGFRCLHCKFVFCRPCARKHFK